MGADRVEGVAQDESRSLRPKAPPEVGRRGQGDPEAAGAVDLVEVVESETRGVRLPYWPENDQVAGQRRLHLGRHGLSHDRHDASLRAHASAPGPPNDTVQAGRSARCLAPEPALWPLERAATLDPVDERAKALSHHYGEVLGRLKVLIDQADRRGY